MGKKSIQIDENLHQEVAEFCKLNNIKTGDFYSDAIKNWLRLSKFGDAPFFEPPVVNVNVKLTGTLDKVEVPIKLNEDDYCVKISEEAAQEAIDKKLYEEPVEVVHEPKSQYEPLRRGGEHWMVEFPEPPKAEWPDDKPKDEEKEPKKPRKRRL